MFGLRMGGKIFLSTRPEMDGLAWHPAFSARASCPDLSPEDCVCTFSALSLVYSDPLKVPVCLTG